MMPPPGCPQPDRPTRDARSSPGSRPRSTSAARATPDPGRPLVHRLNRAEYANAIRDLLALEVDAAALLPPDDSSSGFDNNADVLGVSPVLLESYLTAAERVSALALGDPEHAACRRAVPRPAGRVAGPPRRGLPLGTVGGLLIDAHAAARRRVPVPGQAVPHQPRHDARPRVPAPARDRGRRRARAPGRRSAATRRSRRRATTRRRPATTWTARFTVRVPLKAGPHEIARGVPREDAGAEHAAAAELRPQLVRHHRLLRATRTSTR